MMTGWHVTYLLTIAGNRPLSMVNTTIEIILDKMETDPDCIGGEDIGNVQNEILNYILEDMNARLPEEQKFPPCSTNTSRFVRYTLADCYQALIRRAPETLMDKSSESSDKNSESNAKMLSGQMSLDIVSCTESKNCKKEYNVCVNYEYNPPRIERVLVSSTTGTVSCPASGGWVIPIGISGVNGEIVVTCRTLCE